MSQQAGSLPEQPNEIGYATPRAAAIALREKPGVVMTVQNGWLVATDPSGHAVWYFPPSNDPAYPAVVRRLIYMEGTQVLAKVSIKCGGTKLGCDQMKLAFDHLVQQLSERLSKLPGAVAPPVR